MVPRSFTPVPPDQRRRKQRSASRVVVRSEGRVLLFKDTDPGVPGSGWWVTPGGGIDPGETAAQAAIRELFEEAGLVISEKDLIGPIAVRDVAHGYSDQILVQQETFYAIDVVRFTVDTTGFTEEERLKMVDSGWFTVEELACLTVWPAQLVQLLDADGSVCHDLGQVEESTVPL